jgi:hypothetical protein
VTTQPKVAAIPTLIGEIEQDYPYGPLEYSGIARHCHDYRRVLDQDNGLAGILTPTAFAPLCEFPRV